MRCFKPQKPLAPPGRGLDFGRARPLGECVSRGACTACEAVVNKGTNIADVPISAWALCRNPLHLSARERSETVRLPHP